MDIFMLYKASNEKKWIGYNLKGGFKCHKKRFVWGSTIIPMKGAI